jgi:predicted metal-binding membrane protein
MTSDASAAPGRRADARGRVRDASDATPVNPAAAVPAPAHGPHRFRVLVTAALIVSALAWVALVLWGGGRDMRRGLLTGGSTLTSMHPGASMAGMSMPAGQMPATQMPTTEMHAMAMPGMGTGAAGDGGMSMLGVSMAGKDPASVGYAGLFLWMWAVMILAMMLPAIVPSVRAFLAEDESGARTAGLRFMAAVTTTWLVVGAFLYGALVALNAVLTDGSRLAVGVGAGCVLVAGLFQFTRTKERTLAHVRGPFCRGGGPWGVGLDHGRRCVVSCGPYMVAVALIGMMNLAWMALFAAVMVVEQVAELVAGRGMVVARSVGGVVVVIALGLLLAPGPLPLLA